MRFRNHPSRLFFLILLLTVSACKHTKEDATPDPIVPVDYRDKVAGTYDGTKRDYSWNITPWSHDTIYSYTFEIQKDTAIPGNILVQGSSIPLDSTTYSYYQMPYPGQIFSFDFRNDSALIYTRSGGLGGAFETTIQGKRRP